ncbi:hypothetical protein [Sporolactobacillus pectinivorans]|uniref:hypothetical protein n=1 Tax=Sporolactobacillus pectinivorans TaxID=1591408 RepID=UPI000C25C453|nr:hypothetical protein [Sporolactobacillus pectinivorans]
MNQYAVFEEFNGVTSLPVDTHRPSAVMTAETMMSAIRSFADKNKLKLISFDELEGGSMRAFYQRKKLFHRSEELVYYVCSSGQDD